MSPEVAEEKPDALLAGIEILPFCKRQDGHALFLFVCFFVSKEIIINFWGKIKHNCERLHIHLIILML